MFKTLKRKFIIMYSLSISLILILFSTLIFYTSYKNIEMQTKKEIDINPNQVPFEFKNESFFGVPQNNINPEENNFLRNDIFLKVDDQFHILEHKSYFILSNDELTSIQNQLKNNDSNNLLTVNGITYAYMQENDIIKLINIEQQINILKSLARNLILINLILILISIFLSIFFSNNSIKPIKESYDKQKTFVTDASHELKTPLSVIHSCLTLVKDNDDEKEKWLDYSLKEVERLTTLVSNLLSISKNNIINKKILHSINISDELELLIAAYEVSLFEQNYKLTIDIATGISLPILEDDFNQIVHILLDNAIKYNDNRKQINISLNKKHNSTVLSISNTSKYINQEELNKIFNRFYRIDDSRNKKIEGFGLGLTLLQTMLEKYNFKYNVLYEHSKFKFTIYLNK